MAYITESMLQSYRQNVQKKQHARSNIVLEKASAQKTIFISHSNKDKSIVEGLINYLASFGIKLYVDWNDTGMPRITDRTTAERIKTKISENTFFLILATENAMLSRWVPWEIGVADQMKTIGNIAIIPVVHNNDTEFKGNEYLRLYKRITLDEMFGNRVKLYEANAHQGKNVADWLAG